jgi:hypothetical protein
VFATVALQFDRKTYSAMNVKSCTRLTDIVLLSLLLGLSAMGLRTANAATSQVAELKAQKEDAIAQVNHIVNQPVTAFRRTPDMEVSEFQDGWFHPGAITPDFNNVDVRKSQETALYAAHKYVTSTLNPNMVFLGNELEFNANTKFFYTNRALPKKKLTEDEMVEINRLYRIIGQCDRQLVALEMPASHEKLMDPNIAADGESDASQPRISREKMILIFSGAVVLVVILFVASKFRKQS